MRREGPESRPREDPNQGARDQVLRSALRRSWRTSRSKEDCSDFRHACAGELSRASIIYRLATHMGVFIPNVSEKTAVLRNVTKKNATFEWNVCHHQAIDLVKSAISAETTIRYCDVHQPITIQVDT